MSRVPCHVLREILWLLGTRCPHPFLAKLDGSNPRGYSEIPYISLDVDQCCRVSKHFKLRPGVNCIMSTSSLLLRTRKQRRSEALYKYNAVAPVNRLSPELVSAVFMEGLPEGNLLQPAETWLQRLKFLLVISAVSGGWRKVALDTAPLWSFIVYQAGMSKAADTRQMKIFKQFLIRSKEAIIDLTIILDDDLRLVVVGKARNSIEKRRLEFAPVFRSILEEHSHRCRSFTLFSPDVVAAVGAFCPLPVRMPALKNLTIRTNPHSGDRNDRIVSLFPEGIECQLTAMTITTLTLPELKYIDFCRIHTLALDTKYNRTPSDNLLQILSLFPSLQTLDVRSRMGPPRDPFLPITMPNVTKITIGGDSSILDSIIAPQLQHLSLIDSLPPTSFFDSLRTLCIDFEIMANVLPIMQFASAHTHLVAISLAQHLLCSFDALEFLSAQSAQSDLPGGSNPPCPALKHLRISSPPLARRYWFRHKDRFVDSLRLLLEQRPKLTVEMLDFMPPPDEPTNNSRVDALVADFGTRISMLEEHDLPIPLSELFSRSDD